MSEAQPPRVNIPLVPFADHLGLQIRMAAQGRSEVGYTPLPEHLNSFHVVHGGVCMTLLDVAMARAATSVPDAPSRTAVTVEMSSRFLHPGRGPLVAEGFVLNQTRSLCTCQANVLNAKGRIVATAMGTFKYWHAPLGRPAP